MNLACDPVRQPSESVLRRVRAQPSKENVSPPVPTMASGTLDMKITHEALYFFFSLEFTCFRGLGIGAGHCECLEVRGQLSDAGPGHSDLIHVLQGLLPTEPSSHSQASALFSMK